MSVVSDNNAATTIILREVSDEAKAKFTMETNTSYAGVRTILKPVMPAGIRGAKDCFSCFAW